MGDTKNNCIDMKFDVCEKSVREVQNCFDYLLQEMSVIRNCLKERNSPIDKQFFMQRLEFVTHLAQSTQLDLEANSYASMLQYRALMNNNNPNNMQEWRQSLEMYPNAIEHVQRSAILLMASERSTSSLSPSEKSTESKALTSNDVVKSEPITIKSKYTLNAHESMKSSAMFAKNAIFNATVTFVENLDELIFYVCCTQRKEIIELSRDKQLTPMWRLPAQEQCFGVSTNNNTVMRAICENNQSNPLYVNLIDFGEVLELNKDYKLFRLPEKYNSIPPQAIKCQLVAISGAKQQHKDLMIDKLANCEFANVRLCIKQKTADCLQVELLSDKEEQKEAATNNSKNPFIVETDNVAEETNKIVYKSMRVLVTYVLDAVRFYAQTPLLENEKSCKVSWPDESVYEEQLLSKYPNVGDLVLAQYAVDTFWYRAKVQQVNQQQNKITVIN